jgi:spore maturation protein A
MRRIYPESFADADCGDAIALNFSANLLGLGNAATPAGLRAFARMRGGTAPGTASDEMCRLVVMNTASVQLIPATVAAVRAHLGAAAPFDILACVWLTSLCSVAAGLLTAKALERLCR